MTNFLRAVVGGLGSIRRAPLVQAIAIGTIALSLLLVGTVHLAAFNVAHMATGWGRGVHLIVYLEDDVTDARTQKIADQVGALQGVTDVKIVDAKEAYARLRHSLGDRAALLDGVEESLLPASIEVTLADGLQGLKRIQGQFEKIRRTDGVEDLETMGEWVERVRQIERLLDAAGLLFGALVAVACLFVVAATIRLGIFARREEIEILKLCGATDAFVRAPFLVEGAVQGVVGAAVTVGGLYAMFRLAAPTIEESLGAALCSTPLTFVPTWQVVLALPVGAALGLVGSLLAVRRYVQA